MEKHITNLRTLGAVSVFLCASGGIAQGELLQHWSLNDEEGTSLKKVANNVPGGANWTKGFFKSRTDGQGAFKIRRAPKKGPYRTFADIADVASGTVYLGVTFAGWSFLSMDNENELIRFGLTVNDERKAYAQFQLTRRGDSMYLKGAAFGKRSSSVAGQPLMDAVEDTPLVVVLEVNADEKTYTIHYNIGNRRFKVLGTGTLAPNRTGNYILCALANDFSDPGEFFKVDDVKFGTAQRDVGL